MVNPHSKGMDIVVYNEDGTVKIKFYDPEIANRTPVMLRYFAGIWLILCLLSIALIFRREQKPKITEEIVLTSVEMREDLNPSFNVSEKP